MDPNTMIHLYDIGFRVSLVIMILAILAAVFLFIRFDVPRSYAILTGKAMKKSASAGRKKARETKRKTALYDYDASHTQDIVEHSGKTGRFRIPGRGKTSEQSRRLSTGNTHQTEEAAVKQNPAASVVQSPPLYDNGQTVQLWAQTGENGVFRFDITEDTVIIHTDEVLI